MGSGRENRSSHNWMLLESETWRLPAIARITVKQGGKTAAHIHAGFLFTSGQKKIIKPKQKPALDACLI